MKRILASIGAAAVLATGAIALTPSSASAASGCWGNAGTKTDPEGHRYSARYCHNYQSGDIMWGGQKLGVLYAGDNWFACQEKFPGQDNPPVGSARNDWWLYTQGDTGSAHHSWGWFPATKVSGGNNWERVPGLPDC